MLFWRKAEAQLLAKLGAYTVPPVCPGKIRVPTLCGPYRSTAHLPSQSPRHFGTQKRAGPCPKSQASGRAAAKPEIRAQSSTPVRETRPLRALHPSPFRVHAAPLHVEAVSDSGGRGGDHRGRRGDTSLVTSEPEARGGAEARGRREAQQAGGAPCAEGSPTPPRLGASLGPRAKLPKKFPWSSWGRRTTPLARPWTPPQDPRTKKIPAGPPAPRPTWGISRHLPTRRQRRGRPRGAAAARAGGRGRSEKPKSLILKTS